MTKMKRLAYKLLGLLCVGLAYIGVVTPGIPFSIFIVIAAWAFAKSDPRLHAWLYNHKYFGKYLTNWTKKKVFPLYAKVSMILMMSFSIGLLYIHGSHTGAMYLAITCLLTGIWAWRYPSSTEIYDYRKKHGKRIAWLK